MKEFEIKLDTKMYGELIAGKKVIYTLNLNTKDETRITVYPPHYGVYTTYEELIKILISSKIEHAENTADLIEKLLKLNN